MSASIHEILEKHFEIALEAPDGIRRLREMILTLGMRGKLVPQDPQDEPASELLKKIEAERKRLVKEGKIKEPKPLPEIKQLDIPYKVPSGWNWIRLASITPYSIIDGDWIESKDQDPDGNIRLIQLADVGINIFKNVSSKFINNVTFSKLKCTELIPGDILIARLPNPIGRACIFPYMDQKAITAVDIAIVRLSEFENRVYITKAINTRSFRLQAESCGKGATRFRISTGNLKNLLIPLPPLAEQKRIVAKIDELMKRCDELEKLKEALSEKKEETHRAATAELLKAPDARSAAEAFSFIHARFNALYDSKEYVAELRKSILQLAVMGRLVPQDPSDEPASELLKKIEAEKNRLVREGKIKEPKPLPEIKPEEVPYQAPKGWEWVRLGDIIIAGPTNGFSPNSVDTVTHIKSLTLSATTSGFFKKECIKYIDERIKLNPELWLIPGDILVQRGNTIEYVGVPAVFNGNANEYIFPDLMMRIRVSKLLSPYLIHFLMSAPISRDYLRSCASGTSGTMPKINQLVLRNLMLPLPPLAEQKRIVAKVDRLMALCAEMERGIEAARVKRGALLEAVMASVSG